MVLAVPRRMQTLQSQGAHCEFLPVSELDVRQRWRPRVGSHLRAGQCHSPGVPVQVIGMPMRVDDVRDRKSLFPSALDEGFRRKRRIDQDTLFRVTVS